MQSNAQLLRIDRIHFKKHSAMVQILAKKALIGSLFTKITDPPAVYMTEFGEVARVTLTWDKQSDGINIAKRASVTRRLATGGISRLGCNAPRMKKITQQHRGPVCVNTRNHIHMVVEPRILRNVVQGGRTAGFFVKSAKAKPSKPG